MPDPRGFLGRWSARKRAAGPEAEASPPDDEAAAKTETADEPPADLPPVDALGPESDYAAFMRRNVPQALRRAALRRAWPSNPAITGHKPLVDYDWDVNAPGFGRLRPTDDPARFAAALLARAAERRQASTGTEEDVPSPADPDAAPAEATGDGGSDPADRVAVASAVPAPPSDPHDRATAPDLPLSDES